MGSPYLIYMVVVKRLRHRPFTAVTMGSIPSGLTTFWERVYYAFRYKQTPRPLKADTAYQNTIYTLKYVVY